MFQESRSAPQHQPLHSDWTSCHPYPHAPFWFTNPTKDDPEHWTKHSEYPPAIAISVCCHDIEEDTSTIRAISWQDVGIWDGTEEHGDTMSVYLRPLPKGSIILRDVRGPCIPLPRNPSKDFRMRRNSQSFLFDAFLYIHRRSLHSLDFSSTAILGSVSGSCAV